MEFSDICGHIIFFRLIQSQFKRCAMSAAGAGFNADRTSRIAPSERPQIIENGIR